MEVIIKAATLSCFNSKTVVNFEKRLGPIIFLISVYT